MHSQSSDINVSYEAKSLCLNYLNKLVNILFITLHMVTHHRKEYICADFPPSIKNSPLSRYSRWVATTATLDIVATVWQVWGLQLKTKAKRTRHASTHRLRSSFICIIPHLIIRPHPLTLRIFVHPTAWARNSFHLWQTNYYRTTAAKRFSSRNPCAL